MGASRSMGAGVSATISSVTAIVRPSARAPRRATMRRSICSSSAVTLARSSASDSPALNGPGVNTGASGTRPAPKP